MTNPFYNNIPADPTTASRGRSVVIRNQYGAIALGFDRVNVQLLLKAPLIDPSFTGGTITTPPLTAMGGEIVNAAWVRALALQGIAGAAPMIDHMAWMPPSYAINTLVKDGATYLKSGVVAGGALYPAAERIYHQTVAAITAPPTTYGVARGAYNGTRFALSRNAGATVDLWDGASWATATLAYTPTGTAGIVWDAVNLLFLAVGGIASSANAATSPDGLTWTLRAMPSSATWSNAPFYGNGRIIAFVGSTTTAAYSANGGVSWTPATLPSGAAWSSGGYAAGAHFIVAGGSTSGARSTDGGATWAAVTLPGTFSQVLAANDLLIGYNGSTGWVSSDGGLNWTQVTLPATPNPLGGIVYASGVYILTGASTNTYSANTLLPDPVTGRSPWGIARTTAQNVSQAIAGTTSVLTLQASTTASNLALDTNGFVGSVTNSTAALGGLGTGSYYKRVA